MALATVGGMILSATLGVLLDRAVPKTEFFANCFRMSKLERKAKSVGELRHRLLNHSLMAIKEVLDDSTDLEDMQVLKPEVRKWLEDLAEVMYDVEDLLDMTDGKDLYLVESYLDREEWFLNQQKGLPNQQEDLPNQPEGSLYQEELIISSRSSEQNDSHQAHSYPQPSSTTSTRSRLRRLFHCFPSVSSSARHTHNYLQSSNYKTTSGVGTIRFPNITRDLSSGMDYQRYLAVQGDNSDPSWLYTPRCGYYPLAFSMTSWADKVDNLCKRLDELQTKMVVLDLKRGVKEKAAVRLPTTSLPDEDLLFGRIKELDRILKFPGQNAGCSRKVSVIAIWGMPGVGKTSLAQHVYCDATFNECFDLKAWVCVSDDFNVVRYTKMILEAVSNQRFDTEDLNILQVTLSNTLSDKRFLLVLDDVCNENFDSWDALLKPLKIESKEALVILTTRHKGISISSNADVTLQLDLLPPEDCYTITKKHATYRNEVVDATMDGVCREIGFRCKGLPLAAKAAGRLLRGTPRKKWGCILDNNLWYLVHDTTDVLPALKLSYQYLPSHLKPCFSYCSLFPKDYEYDRKKLVLLWIAEGFVKQEEDGKSIEEEGQAYFDELFSRSFFQISSRNTLYFVMHDLFHDLAQFVSKQFFCRVGHNKKYQISSKIRHLSYERRNCDELRNIFRPSYHHLRTFIAIDNQADYFYVSLRAMNVFLPKMRNLRVLSLSHYQIYYLSEAICNLEQLHFLDVSFTKIKRLPDKFCNLSNLQILLLSHCSELMQLPFDMHRLTSLWHLDLSGTALTHLPLNMRDISSLHTLGKIVRDPCKLDELKMLKHLQGSLCISISKGTPSLTHGSDSYLQHFEGLQELEIDFMSASSDSGDQAKVLSLLQPHCNLKNLSIRGYGGISFPDWVSFFKVSRLVSLHIIDCESCLFFPSIGELPSLERLCLSGFRKVKRVGVELYGGGSQRTNAFQSLKILIIENMPEWEEWLPQEGGGRDFRCLKELYVRNCPKLIQQVPFDIPSLEKLVISECPQLNAASHFFPFILSRNTTIPDNMGTGSHLSSLELSFLPQLSSLPQEILQLTSLKSLDISNIPTIKSFPDFPFPKSLVSLRIEECNLLLSLPNRLMHVVTLVISRCPSLMSFPENVVLASLKILKIKHCKSLQFMSLQDLPRKPNLTTLEIDDSCDSLKSFAFRSFSELCNLKISNCKSLESLCFLGSPDHDMHLLHVHISECTKLGEISLPEGGLPAPCLQELTLSHCLSLESIPEDMFKRLTSLESLNLDHCPKLQPILHWHSLPSVLVSLSCTGAIFNSVRLSRQLDQFVALKNLKLDGLEVESFPEDDWIPSGITTLTISDFPNLKYINKAINDVKCLEEFVIRICPKVERVPRTGFPSSLLYLQAVDCPLLEEDMLAHGRSMIMYVPCVIVGYTVI